LAQIARRHAVRENR